MTVEIYLVVAFKKCCKFFVTNRDFQKHEEVGIAMKRPEEENEEFCPFLFLLS